MTNFTRLTRKEAIDMLVEYRTEMFRDEEYFDIDDIIRFGLRGVEKYTDRELLEELEIFQDPSAPFQLVSIIHKEI